MLTLSALSISLSLRFRIRNALLLCALTHSTPSVRNKQQHSSPHNTIYAAHFMRRTATKRARFTQRCACATVCASTARAQHKTEIIIRMFCRDKHIRESARVEGKVPRVIMYVNAAVNPNAVFV